VGILQYKLENKFFQLFLFQQFLLIKMHVKTQLVHNYSPPKGYSNIKGAYIRYCFIEVVFSIIYIIFIVPRRDEGEIGIAFIQDHGRQAADWQRPAPKRRRLCIVSRA
jgi:hypothetical protein